MAPARSKSRSSLVKKTKPDCRIKTLANKSSLLSTLCGASVSFVCFTPNGDTFTWPEDKAELRSILDRYRQHQIAAAAAEKNGAANKKKRKRVDDDGGEGFHGLSSSSSLVPGNTHLGGLLNLLDVKLQCVNEKIRVLEKKKKIDSFLRETEWVEFGEISRWSKEEIEEVDSWVFEFPEPELGVAGVLEFPEPQLGVAGDMKFCGEEGIESSLSKEEIDSWVLEVPEPELGVAGVVKVLEPELGVAGDMKFCGEEGIESSLSEEEIDSWVLEVPEPELAVAGVLEFPEPELTVAGVLEFPEPELVVARDMKFCGEGIQLGDLGSEGEASKFCREGEESVEWGLSLEDLTDSGELEMTPDMCCLWFNGED